MRFLSELTNRQKSRIARRLAYIAVGLDAGITIYNCLFFPILIPVSIVGKVVGVAYAVYIYHRPMEWTVVSVIVGFLMFIFMQWLILTSLLSAILAAGNWELSLFWFLLYGAALPGGPMTTGQFLKISSQYLHNSQLRQKRQGGR